jgi:hypothetical protein
MKFEPGLVDLPPDKDKAELDGGDEIDVEEENLEEIAKDTK